MDGQLIYSSALLSSAPVGNVRINGQFHYSKNPPPMSTNVLVLGQGRVTFVTPTEAADRVKSNREKPYTY
jgi:hypothetical protein